MNKEHRQELSLSVVQFHNNTQPFELKRINKRYCKVLNKSQKSNSDWVSNAGSDHDCVVVGINGNVAVAEFRIPCGAVQKHS